MAQKLQVQAHDPRIGDDFLKAKAPVKNSEYYQNYIIVPDNKLKLFIKADDPIIYHYAVREDDIQYQNTSEDKFIESDPDTVGDAFVYHNEVYSVFFVYMPQNGRLYYSESLFEVCDILRLLKAHENSKIIK